jgi:RNA-directed DNA polymerase
VCRRSILTNLFRRRISRERTLALMKTIVDASIAQAPAELHFPGDDLFEPYRRRSGLPIGNLSSQFFANLYLDRFDHWVSERLGTPYTPYVRYVDDFALFQDDPVVLAEWRNQIERYLEGRRLKLHPRKTAILPTSEPTAFLGFELHTGPRRHGGDKADRGQRRLPKENVARFRNRLPRLLDRWRAGTATKLDVEARIGAWIAHANHADTFWLRQDMCPKA